VKSLSDQDHYEALEVRRGASAEEIERAYRLALGTYMEDSLAGYSVFEAGDVEAIRERVELAFRTLSDTEARRAYDAQLARGEPAPPALVQDEVRGEPGAAAASRPVLAELDALEDIDEESGEFDGARLRRVRLRQGVEIRDIARITKVNPTYLSYIEEERFESLPAAVYVRGFVMGYASCIGLDAAAVARSFMKRFEASRGGRKRSLFSRR
jgi:flagellar biosynthesis protein FlhG